MNHLVARLSCVRLISCYPDAISANCCEAWAWPLTERSPTEVPEHSLPEPGSSAQEEQEAGSWLCREEPPGSHTQLLGRAVGQSILDQLWPQMGPGR